MFPDPARSPVGNRILYSFSYQQGNGDRSYQRVSHCGASVNPGPQTMDFCEVEVAEYRYLQ